MIRPIRPSLHTMYIPDVLTSGYLNPNALATSGLITPEVTETPNSVSENPPILLDPPSPTGIGKVGVPVLPPALNRAFATPVPGTTIPTYNQQLMGSMTSTAVDEGTYSFAGSDIRVMLEMAGKPKYLFEIVTLSISIHREKSPVRASGYINPKAFARGRRTIGGTMVLTQFNVDFLFRFLSAKYSKDLSKDSHIKKIDQLPPFNLTISMKDEFGNSSTQQLRGVEIVTDGSVYSSNDLFTERAITYMAADFTPLVPDNYIGQIDADTSSDPDVTGAQRSVRDVMQERQAQNPPFPTGTAGLAQIAAQQYDPSAWALTPVTRT